MIGEQRKKLMGEIYGESWLGLAMERVGDTGIYRIAIPLKAKNIIFNSGAADQDIIDGKNGYQTADLKFDENANAGQIYTIDTSTPAKAGRGVAEKTKYRYTAGEWKNYTA